MALTERALVLFVLDSDSIAINVDLIAWLKTLRWSVAFEDRWLIWFCMCSVIGLGNFGLAQESSTHGGGRKQRAVFVFSRLCAAL